MVFVLVHRYLSILEKYVIMGNILNLGLLFTALKLVV